MGEAYATLLLQIGEGGTVDRYSRLILDKFVHEYRKYIRSYRVIERDANIDQVIESESGSGLHYKGIIPNVMIEVKAAVPALFCDLNYFSNVHMDRELDGKGQTILGVWFLPKHLDLKK
jgi:hypothetical protein